jgi:hypothetical protein
MSADDLDAALSAAQDDATCILCGAETSGFTAVTTNRI